MTDELKKSGIAAVVGRANVGKSTLMNRIVEDKVSIVSPVAQTTRNLIRAILSDERGQLVVLDTPGVHRAEHDLGKIMNRSARKAIEGADVVLLLLDRSNVPRDEDVGWMRRLGAAGIPWVVAFNKCDLPADHSEEYREQWRTIDAEDGVTVGPVEWRMTSASGGDGVAELVDCLFSRLPVGPPLFSEDLLTDFPRNWTIADVVREKLYARLRDELPHRVAVCVDKVTEKADGWDVDALIYVDRPSQKGIVIGHKGRLLKTINREAVADLDEMFDCSIKLHLWVKVEKNWARNHWILQKMGYT